MSPVISAARGKQLLARACTLSLLAALLSACTVNPYRDRPYEPVPPAPRAPQPQSQPAPRPGPVISPPPAPQPSAPPRPATQTSHPRYAPPPHLPAYWDNQLGVYVVKGRELFYRERLYYRQAGGWQCAPTPDGPWEPVALPSVPPGLRSR